MWEVALHIITKVLLTMALFTFFRLNTCWENGFVSVISLGQERKVRKPSRNSLHWWEAVFLCKFWGRWCDVLMFFCVVSATPAGNSSNRWSDHKVLPHQYWTVCGSHLQSTRRSCKYIDLFWQNILRECIPPFLPAVDVSLQNAWISNIEY